MSSMDHPIKDLWDAAGEVEHLEFQVSAIQTALDLWTERVESELPPDKPEEAVACVNFTGRFSMYLCLLRCIQEDLYQRTTELTELSEALYTAAREERARKKKAETPTPIPTPVKEEEPVNAGN